MNGRLMEAAQLHADQMADARRMAHVLPGAPLPRAVDRLEASRYAWSAYGDNIAYVQHTAKDTMAGWMRSKGHRANILDGTFTEIGVGYARDRGGRPYCVQVFGRPR